MHVIDVHMFAMGTNKKRKKEKENEACILAHLFTYL
jgi:hypothetical protein